MRTVKNPEIAELYTKIGDNPHFLEVPSEMPFVESPLHTAASEGRTNLALEILRLKPSLGKKLNLDGLSPLHLALDKGHTNTVKRLIKHNLNLIRVPGREGITLLHYAVEKEEIDLLIYFLLICPLSINDLTVRDETAVHIAVINNNLGAFKVLFGWAKRTGYKNVFRWRNKDGNTLIHLAALTNQPEVMKSLIGLVHVNKKNLEGKTALEILKPENEEARKILISAGNKEGSSLVNRAIAKYLHIQDEATVFETYLKPKMRLIDYLLQYGAYLDLGLSGDMRNAILVVVVLIATAAFQAALTPPFWISHGDNTTSTNSTSTNFKKKITLSMAKENIFINTIAFGLAMGTCLILTLNRVHLFLFPSVYLFSLSYGVLAYAIYPGTEALFIIIAVGALIELSLRIIQPWTIILIKGKISGDICYEYNPAEVIYLLFSSQYINQGPILTRMAKIKAS
ncbi:ankyrin repeat-containing protein BDA1-like [Olea europaea var. sylvestris]|uniref:ankyrin repeat-containing protein BDA1-like n=1 Tax=Olea europaea var. sylvestris TaxID=158386 RepID=UPI000C1D7074|nr:ankyrin repeat-containing protein BDA1-like [Olea europaea var. sylvestris]